MIKSSSASTDQRALYRISGRTDQAFTPGPVEATSPFRQHSPATATSWNGSPPTWPIWATASTRTDRAIKSMSASSCISGAHLRRSRSALLWEVCAHSARAAWTLPPSYPNWRRSSPSAAYLSLSREWSRSFRSSARRAKNTRSRPVAWSSISETATLTRNRSGKCSLDAFLSELVIYRNKGFGHQAEESMVSYGILTCMRSSSAISRRRSTTCSAGSRCATCSASTR
jgi:hypothetical protein